MFLIAAGIVLLLVFGTAVWHAAVRVTMDQKSTASSPRLQQTAMKEQDKAASERESFPVKGAVIRESESTPDIPRPPESAEDTGTPRDRTAPESLPVKESLPEKAPEPEPEIMTGGPLTLQAVSWSRSPQKRFAVINGKICREGELIQNYRVRKINAKEVQVTDGGRTWRLVLSVR